MVVSVSLLYVTESQFVAQDLVRRSLYGPFVHFVFVLIHSCDQWNVCALYRHDPHLTLVWSQSLL